MTGFSRSQRLLLNAGPVVLGIAIWWVVTTYLLVQPRLYPPPQDVVRELFRILSNDGPLGDPYAHAGATLMRLLLSWALAFVIGTLLGVVAGRKRLVFDFLANPVWIAMSVPSVVWVFILLVLFGIDNIVPISALVLLLSAPVFLGTAEGVRDISHDLLEMCESYHVKGWQRLTEFYLPSIAAYMVSNARVSFAYGIRIVLIAEVIGLPNGIGILVAYWSDTLFMAPIVAWGILLTGVGMVVDLLIFGPLQRRIRQETDLFR